MNVKQLELEVHDTYKKDEKITTNFEAFGDSDVSNKVHLDEKLSKIDGHESLLEKDYNEFQTLSRKQSVEERLVQRAVKTTIQVLYDKGSFGIFPNADKVLKDLLLVQRRRPASEKVMMSFNDFVHKQLLKNVKSDINIYQVLTSPKSDNVDIYLRDGSFKTDMGIVNSPPFQGNCWALYINEIYFDSSGCSPPQKPSKIVIKRNKHCLYSEYKIQGLMSKRDSFRAS